MALQCREIDPEWTHEYVPSAAPSEIVWHANDFAKTPEVEADAEEIQPGFKRWFTMPPRMPRCFGDVLTMF